CARAFCSRGVCYAGFSLDVW
nr:immunoglobulin heavy chain junction region [Macaca mulatta]MOV41644.1 immunoglobulin heavy chain junction region [Macaca mulatta]MOV44057.1 immunoglobulin heavy chain junction region [Macaca mulatta]MOV44501.1 immunoglobulin heavy chain junction region [Macaca mulatta]